MVYNGIQKHPIPGGVAVKQCVRYPHEKSYNVTEDKEGLNNLRNTHVYRSEASVFTEVICNRYS